MDDNQRKITELGGINFLEERKITELGGINFLEERKNDQGINDYLINVESIMGTLPAQEVIKFIKSYGFSTFKNHVMIRAIEKSSFLSTGEIELGLIFGFGDGTNSIMSSIDTYFVEEQMKWKFFPLFEGYPGDVVFYSLESETWGKIYYWHHEADINDDKLLIADSFTEFIDNLYLKQLDKEEDQPELSADELVATNERRKRVGLPLIDKSRNEIN